MRRPLTNVAGRLALGCEAGSLHTRAAELAIALAAMIEEPAEMVVALAWSSDRFCGNALEDGSPGSVVKISTSTAYSVEARRVSHTESGSRAWCRRDEAGAQHSAPEPLGDWIDRMRRELDVDSLEVYRDPRDPGVTCYMLTRDDNARRILVSDLVAQSARDVRMLVRAELRAAARLMPARRSLTNATRAHSP
jgi:hypothetical protein